MSKRKHVADTLKWFKRILRNLGVDDTSLAKLILDADSIEPLPGTILFEQGATNVEYVYFVRSGCVLVTVTVGDSIFGFIASSGMYFGDVAMFVDGPRAGAAIVLECASSDCRLVALKQSCLRTAFESNPELIERFTQESYQRQLRVTHYLSEATLPTTLRVAKCLDEYAVQCGTMVTESETVLDFMASEQELACLVPASLADTIAALQELEALGGLSKYAQPNQRMKYILARSILREVIATSESRRANSTVAGD